MFHRVKSEAQTSQPDTEEQKNASAQEVVKSAPQESAVTPAVSANNEAMNKASEQPDEKTTPVSTSNEDKKTMSEQDNNQTEQAAPEKNEFPANPYARAGMAPAARTASVYPGSYGAAGKPVEVAGSSSDRRLTIGAGITLSGEIEACDYLLVEGTVEAALKGANMLDVAESGVFYGTVEINEATIAGRFEGDISVNGRLTITSTGTVTGSIAYKELAIEAGAIIDGKITPLDALEASKGKKPTSAKTKGSSAKEAKSDAQEAANNDGELFSKTVAAAE